MNETRTRLGLLPRRLLALGLVAWLAGLGCVLGCEAASGVASSPSSREESSGESCAAMSASGHGCCHRAKSRGGATAAGVPAQRGETFMHCPLARQTSDPARKVRTNDAPATAAAPPRSYESESRQFDEATTPRPRAHDRGGTYLRCCVFLI